jgi:3-oxoacyl-[acyl-carrier protein] reductase
MRDSRDLRGTVVLVTGATSGIGRATTAALLAEGANVVATGRREERLAELMEQHGDERLLTHAADIRKPATSRELVDLAVKRWGGLDSAVLNAGLGRDGSILDGDDAEMEELLVTNLHSVVWGIRSVVPQMAKQGGGDIIVMASVAGLRGAKHEAVYAAGKAGAIELAATTDRELRASGIPVSAICPAAVATEFALGHGRSPDMPQMAQWMQSEDIADAILFMLRQPRRMRTTQIDLWSAGEGS